MTATNAQQSVYAYRDRVGDLVYEVVRKPGKRFMQRRRDPAGAEVWNLEGVERIPYRWVELDAAIDAGEDVYVVEGEKDADRLAELGLCATTSSGGAAWAWPPDWAEHFRGAPAVYVLADDDEPGRAAAHQRARVIARAVTDVRVVEDWPGVDDKGDVSDWLDLGHDRAELERHAAAGIPPKPAGGEAPTNGHRPARRVTVDSLPFTDLGNARRLVAGHGHDLRYAPQLGVWFVWDGRRWAEDLTGEVHRRAKAVADALLAEIDTCPGHEQRNAVRHWERSQHAARLAATVTVASSEPKIPITVDELDDDPWVLNVANGTIDLRTGRLRPHDRGDLITKLAPVDYNPALGAPTWTEFLDAVFAGDAELIGFVQRLVGYSITGDISEQVLPIPFGPGANGKSTFLGVLKAVLGDYATAIDPSLLIAADHPQHPTGLMDLRGARFVITIEVEQGRRLAESLVKQLTGGDPITARRMRQDFVTFAPTHKLWLAANHLPRVRGTDHAIWRRLAVVPFNVTFDGANRDPQLAGKLLAEGPGILAWAVQGVAQWLAHGLDVPEPVRAATDGYRGQEDHVGRFLAECCVIGDDVGQNVEVPAADLRRAYEAWCGAQGERPWTQKAVGAELTRRGLDRYQAGRTKTWTWIGVGLVAPAPVSATAP